jgi:hypothetical protein
VRNNDLISHKYYSSWIFRAVLQLTKPYRIYHRKLIAQEFGSLLIQNRLKGFSQRTSLDVGGPSAALNYLINNENYRIIAINIDMYQPSGISFDYEFVIGSGTHLPFRNGSITYVFCDEVIEHISNNKKGLAREIMRVGQGFFLATPNRHFFLEPHTFIPFLQYLPKNIRKLIFPWMRDVELLSFRELQALFPHRVIKGIGPRAPLAETLICFG